MTQQRADRAGIFLSSLCAFHCGAGALIAGATGWIGIFFDETAEAAFVLAAASLAVWAFSRGLRRHRVVLPAMIGALGVGALLLARIGLPEPAELPMSLGGAGLLVVAHVQNLRALRAHDPCCDDDAAAATEPPVL